MTHDTPHGQNGCDASESNSTTTRRSRLRRLLARARRAVVRRLSTRRERSSWGVPAVVLAADGLDLDEYFELVSNYRRRQIIRILDAETAAVGDGYLKRGPLADQITARETGRPPDDVDSDERKRAYVGLYQVHLPKLADAGIVDWDQDGDDVVRATALTGPVADHLRAWAAHQGGDRPDPDFYKSVGDGGESHPGGPAPGAPAGDGDGDDAPAANGGEPA